MNGVWTTGWRSMFTIVPAERRGHVNAFMDGGSWQGGMMLAGIALIMADALLSRRSIFLFAAGAAAVATVAMWRARGAYGREVLEAVRAGRPDVFLVEEEPFGGFRTDAAAVAAVVESAADPDVDVRRVAMEIAAGLGAREALPALIAGATDDDPQIKAAALRGLARYPDPSATPIAAAALRDEDPEVRARGVDALVASSDGVGGLVGQLQPLLSDPDAVVRARAAVGLARDSADPQGLEFLAAMLRSPDPASRAAAAEGFGELDEGAGLIQGAMTDGDPGVRRAATAARGRFSGDGAVGTLIAALGDGDATVRDSAVAAMTSLGSLAVGPLQDALAYPELEVEALRALIEIGGADPERLLDYARDQVARAIHYGHLAQELAPDPDERVELLAY
jgi:HEAT repeat protein